MSTYLREEPKKFFIGDKFDNGYIIVDGPRFRFYGERKNKKTEFLFRCEKCGEEKWLDQFWGTKSKHSYCTGVVVNRWPIGTVVNNQIISSDLQQVKGKLRYLVVCSGCNQESWRTEETVKRNKLGCVSCSAKQKKSKYLLEKDKVSNAFLSQVKSNAKTRKISVSLTSSDVERLIFNNCFYCGANPEPRKVRGLNIKSNGIDRVDSSLGYEIENCVTCCKQCNLAKLSYSQEEFLEWINRVYLYQQGLTHE